MCLLNTWTSKVTWKSLAYLFFSPLILFLVQIYSWIVFSSLSLEKDHLFRSRSCFDLVLVWDALQLDPLGLKLKCCSVAHCPHSCHLRVFCIGDGHHLNAGGPLASPSHFSCVGTIKGTLLSKWKNSLYNAKARQGKSQFGCFSGNFHPYRVPTLISQQIFIISLWCGARLWC